MHIICSHFITLDGVVQAPGGPQEDIDGGFATAGPLELVSAEPTSTGVVMCTYRVVRD